MTRDLRPSLAWAAGTLRRCEMPPEEIRAVLTADDPEIVRRFLELHRERLEEQIEEQRRTLAWLERSLTEEILERDRLVDLEDVPSTQVALDRADVR